MTPPAGPEEVREPDFEAALRWARCRLKFGSPSGENETERDDNLARAYVALTRAVGPEEPVVREWRMDALHDLYELGDPNEIIGRVDAMNEHNAAIRHLRAQLNLARAALAQDRK